MYDKQIVNRIWSNYGDIAIVRDFAPGTDREEVELFEHIRQTRTAIEKLVRELPPIVESALRGGFTTKQVFDTITENGEGLIPPFNLECLIAGAQAKIDAEKQTAQEAVDKAESEARLAAIRKRIDDARQALLDSGLPC